MKTKTFVFSAWILFLVVLAANRTAAWYGIALNHSGSLPVGLWHTKSIDRPIVRGDIVAFCPPDNEALRIARERDYIGRGGCPGDYERMIKPVAAVGGDVVTVADDGLYINGQLLPNSAPVVNDSKNRPLPRIRQTVTLAQDEFWMYSSYVTKSYDSRYFGLIKAPKITHFVSPLLTMK